jgi:hypothetical protein
MYNADLSGDDARPVIQVTGLAKDYRVYDKP